MSPTMLPFGVRAGHGIRDSWLVRTVAILTALLCACGQTGSATQSPPNPTPSAASVVPSASPTDLPSVRPDVLATPTVYGAFAVRGHELRMICYGSGAPTIVFEAGTDSSGIQSFPKALVRPLAETNQVCLYDRLGTGSSDPPTEVRRTIDDVVADFDALFAAANVRPPYLLAGQSGGGNIAIWYAVRHAKNVAGLVLIDVGGPEPEMMAKEFPGAQAWGGSEHIDWVDADLLQSKIKMPIADFPVLIITADHGQGNPSTPSVWRKLSPRAREIVKHGGHDLHEEIPAEIATEIRSVIADL